MLCLVLGCVYSVTGVFEAVKAGVSLLNIVRSVCTELACLSFGNLAMLTLRRRWVALALLPMCAIRVIIDIDIARTV